MNRKRKATEAACDLLEIEEDARCQREGCGRAEWEKGNEMIACDGCNDCYHLRCLDLGRVPVGDWFCRECSPLYAREPRPAGPTTFQLARQKRSCRVTKRARVGLGPGLPTLADLEELEKAGTSEATRKKVEQVEGKLEELERWVGLPRSDPVVFKLFVTWRVKESKAVSTITTEMSVLKKVPGIGIPSELELKNLTQAVKRMAEVPGSAKDPLLKDELIKMKRVLVGSSWRDDGSEEMTRRLRNWTFFCLAFLGMFRSKELLTLDWDHVAIGWDDEGQLEELPVGRVGRGRAAYVVIFLDETKTELDGAAVRLQAGPESSPLTCPVRLLQKLRRRARGPAVFSEVRLRFEATEIAYGTMLGTFKRTLGLAGVPETRIARLALHSLRRGGATEAAAQGATMREIMTQGRWKSDVAYIYALISDQVALNLTGKLAKGLSDIAYDSKLGT